MTKEPLPKVEDGPASVVVFPAKAVAEKHADKQYKINFLIVRPFSS
jgi:hypothetical protein